MSVIIKHEPFRRVFEKPEPDYESWVYVDWDGEVFLENNEPHDNFELYSHLDLKATRHVVWVRPYNGNITTSVSVSI